MDAGQKTSQVAAAYIVGVIDEVQKKRVVCRMCAFGRPKHDTGRLGGGGEEE